MQTSSSTIATGKLTASIPAYDIIESQAETFKALAHPSRLAIIYALREGPICACELADIAQSSPSTTSRHLTVLRHSGIISSTREGKQIFYKLDRPCVLQFVDCCHS